jgi:hypothetical protein
MWLITYEKATGIILAPTRKKAETLKRFLRLRGTLTELQSSHGHELTLVHGWYEQIAETERLLRTLRAARPMDGEGTKL